MEPELDHCPFCAGEATFARVGLNHVVRCAADSPLDCPVRPETVQTLNMDAAAYHWNHRSQGIPAICDDCGKPMTEKGALRLFIGVPDGDGKFQGTKEHVCVDCVKEDTP